jgi:predicted amidohydrolase YtcJ
MRFVSVALCLAIAGTGLLTSGCAMDTADIALRSGKVFTMDPAQPWAEAVIIQDGRVLHVGEDYKIDELAGPRTRIIDLHGRLVVPGLCDAHTQLLSAALAEHGIDLEEALPGFTVYGDFASRAEDACGPIRVGGYADLVVLDRDLFEARPDEIAGTRIDLTLFEGEIVYERK